MKERLRAMVEQKEFLANQLKALMKRNKVLEVSNSCSPAFPCGQMNLVSHIQNDLESLKHGDAQSIISGWCRNKASKVGTPFTPLDTVSSPAQIYFYS